MNKKFLLYINIIALCASFALVSCGEKKSPEEKEASKVQELYDKKGMGGFLKYVEKNAYITVTDSSRNGATPFLLVVQTGDIESANLFLEKGASVEEKDLNGGDLLDYALEAEKAEALDFAISKMPPFYWNNADSDGKLPLSKIIARCSDFAAIKKAIDLTSDLNHADKNDKTLLMYAAQCSSDVRAVKYLLDKGAKIDEKNENEWTALMYAARYNPNPAVMEDLLLRGASAEPNSVGLTLTMLAACNPNAGVLFTLLKYKNEVNAATDKGKTALIYACENNQTAQVIKMLINSGADLTAKDASGKTVREYLSANSKLSASDMAEAWKSAEGNANSEETGEKSTEDEATISEETKEAPASETESRNTESEQKKQEE